LGVGCGFRGLARGEGRETYRLWWAEIWDVRARRARFWVKKVFEGEAVTAISWVVSD
jgi:hypothetical protein